MASALRLQPDTPFDVLSNRELSSLDVAGRILELAGDAGEPLLERVRFCGIVSSLLDEFFMLRMAGLVDEVTSSRATLAEIRARVLTVTADQSRLWRDELCPALAREQIVIGGVEDAPPDALHELESKFRRRVFPVLTPLAVEPDRPVPDVSGLSLNLGVVVRDPESGEERLARVKVPEGLDRFVPVGTRGLLIPLEDVIAHFLGRLFPGMEVVERTAFRLTRDGDTEVPGDPDGLLEAVESGLQRRRYGPVVRLEALSSTSQSLLARLSDRLGVPCDGAYAIDGLLDLDDLDELYALDRPDLKYAPWVPRTRPRLAARADIFTEIARRDVVVQHPYDSFETSVEAFVRAAAHDPRTAALKTTVYRTSHDSALAPALIAAAGHGKQSVCVVELRARFDERRNIEWARTLEQAGVQVAYGFPDLKVHAKTTLVVRRESDGGLRRFAHIGTGNYHPTTARIYEDVGLFTADPEITADVADLFDFVTGSGRPRRFRKLLVAPFNLRERLVWHIRTVAEAAEQGKPARIRIKVNNLTDREIVRELYGASQAGAEIDLIVRAICTLVPGLPGVSESIRVRSVLGRFLEHSRLYSFEAHDETTYLLGSADLMPRNLDHRIEVVTPVEDAHVQAEIESILSALLADNSQAWELGRDGAWTRVTPKQSERRRAAQATFLYRRSA